MSVVSCACGDCGSSWLLRGAPPKASALSLSVDAPALWLPQRCARPCAGREADAARVPAILAAMPRKQVDTLFAELMRVRAFFSWAHGKAVAQDGTHADAFDMLLLEVFAKTQLCT